MEDTRSFPLIETMGTMEITLNHIDGQNIVYWEDIEQVFPGVGRVRNGHSVIKFIRGSNQERIMPYSINCCSHSVLDVVLSTSVEPVGVDFSRLDRTDRQTGVTDAPVDAPIEDRIATALDVTPRTSETAVGNFSFLDTSSSPSSDVDTSSKAILFQQIVTRASRMARESEIEERFISLLAPEIQGTVRASSDIYQAFAKAMKDGHVELSLADLRQELSVPFQKLEAVMEAKNIELQEAMSVMRKEMNAKQEEANQLQKQVRDNQKEMNAKQDKVDQLHKQILNNQQDLKQLQVRALDQLAQLQSRVQAVLTQTYELHEYPIPRLFVVLPQEPSGWDTMSPFSNKFRLYFLCECGEHTKSINGKTKIPHHIHLAKHEGYEIARPSEFFQQYGPYVLTILKMLKFGVTVAGVAIPTISQLISPDVLGQTVYGLKQLQDTLVSKVDQVIDWMDKDSVDDGEGIEGVIGQVDSKEALEGADLRRLETFLKDKDGNKVLGNLYRTVTDEGHVKWVCMDHYRENYNEMAAEAFRRAVDSVGGSFDENNGRVKVTLRSRVLAEQFYSVLLKARSVYELEIDLDMEGNRSDFEALEDTLAKSGISILCLNLRQFRLDIAGKLSSTSARYDVLIRIVERPNMKSIHIVLPGDLIKLSNFSPKRISHLRKLSAELTIGLIGGKDLRLLSEALKTNSILTTLDLQSNSIGDNGAQALSEALKTNSTLITLKLQSNSIGDNGTQALSEALKTNSTLTTLDLNKNSIGDDGAQALSEALKTNSTLTTLDLKDNSIWFKGFLALSEIPKSNSTLTTLDLKGNKIGSNEAQALSEAIKTNSTLTNLELQSNKIGDNGAQALSEVLKTNSTLITFNLGYNSIGDKGARALSEALKTNSTLAILKLQSNKVGDNGAQALSEALKTNSTLTTLDLDENSIGDNGAHVLSVALKTNSTLTTFNLGYNSIGDNGAQALSEALKTNSTLTTLKLQSNKVGDNGAQALSEALKTNSTLTTFNLYSNWIGDKGAQALSEALKISSTLTTFNLGYNSIGDNGAQALSEALKTNSTLTTLELQSNSIGDNGAQALSEALKTNSTLTTLDLYNNSIGFYAAQALSEALKINSTLTIKSEYIRLERYQ